MPLCTAPLGTAVWAGHGEYAAAGASARSHVRYARCRSFARRYYDLLTTASTPMIAENVGVSQAFLAPCTTLAL